MRFRFLSYVLRFSLAVSLSLTARAQTLRVWAVGDAVRVSPVTGNLIEDRTNIHKDYPTGDYRARNAIWESGTKTVSLKAARNEFIAFQLVLDTPQPVDGIDVKLGALDNASGARISGRNVALLKEWYVQVRRSSSGYPNTSLGTDWYPDALLPTRTAGRSR